MRRSVALVILSGYLLLVPACFLAENFSANMKMAPDHCMMGMPCSENSPATAGAPLGAVSDHLSMYTSMTGFIHETVTLFGVLVFVISITFFERYASLHAEAALRINSLLYYRRNRKVHLHSLRDLLDWNSLLTASPPRSSFA